MSTYGWAWHIHHNVLLEPLTEPIEARQQYIRKYKPHNEQKLRLRLLREVVGQIPAAYIKAQDDYIKAQDDYIKAQGDYNKARGDYDKAPGDCDKAQDDLTKARDDYTKAWDAYIRTWDDYMPAILALHAVECPNCPWDGYTIFSRKGEQ